MRSANTGSCRTSHGRRACRTRSSSSADAAELEAPPLPPLTAGVRAKIRRHGQVYLAPAPTPSRTRLVPMAGWVSGVMFALSRTLCRTNRRNSCWLISPVSVPVGAAPSKARGRDAPTHCAPLGSPSIMTSGSVLPASDPRTTVVSKTGRSSATAPSVKLQIDDENEEDALARVALGGVEGRTGHWRPSARKLATSNSSSASTSAPT